MDLDGSDACDPGHQGTQSDRTDLEYGGEQQQARGELRVAVEFKQSFDARNRR